MKHTCKSNINDCDSAEGSGYWNIFKKYNDDLIMTKKSEHFELDRQNWTTYSNFKLEHDKIIEMADSVIAVELEVPL